MALRLGNYVVAGELFNTRRHSTHGWLAIRGWEQPMHLEFTGDPGPDLMGRRLYFEASSRIYGGTEKGDGTQLDMEPRQFGATGTMTAHDVVRVFEGSVENFIRRSDLGEPPPTEWKRRLYLEWFGNSGRVVLELVDPCMYFIEVRDGVEVKVALDPPETPPFHPDFPPEPSAPAISPDPIGGEPANYVEFSSAPFTDESMEPEDPFGLFPPNLDPTLKESLGSDEGAFNSGEEDDDLLAEMVLMDDLMEKGGGMELGEIVGKMPPWDTISEERAETLVKMIVGRLAIYRVALDICEHFTMRDAYRVITGELAEECKVHPELIGTGWVTHLSTSDTCPECAKEFEDE